MISVKRYKAVVLIVVSLLVLAIGLFLSEGVVQKLPFNLFILSAPVVIGFLAYQLWQGNLKWDTLRNMFSEKGLVLPKRAKELIKELMVNEHRLKAFRENGVLKVPSLSFGDQLTYKLHGKPRFKVEIEVLEGEFPGYYTMDVPLYAGETAITGELGNKLRGTLETSFDRPRKYALESPGTREGMEMEVMKEALEHGVPDLAWLSYLGRSKSDSRARNLDEEGGEEEWEEEQSSDVL